MSVDGEDLLIKAGDDLFLDSLGDDVHVRADDDIRMKPNYNFTDFVTGWETIFRGSGETEYYDSDAGNTYGYIRPVSDNDRRVLQFEGYDKVVLRSETGNKNWTFDGEGKLRLPIAGDIVDANGDSVLGSAVVRQDTAPIAANGTLWFNTVEGTLYINYNDQWVDASPTVLPPPDTNPEVESVTFNDNTVQTTAWPGTLSYDDLTDKPAAPAFVGGGGASTWLTAD
jgi:hypothetical protein